MTEFAPGQRWVSNTESELGLGVVEECAHRRVTLSFPAAEEQRTYATDNAPLSRVQYSIDERVSTDDGVSFVITDRYEEFNCFVYVGVDDTGKTLRIEEEALDSKVQFSKPQDRLFAGQIDNHRLFELRVRTLRHHHEQQQSANRGLLGPRIQLLPHQLYIASQVASRHAPRVLLADEVGLGKTIEAGLILHQQLITGRATRVLVVTPENLLHQWLVEMLRKFNLSFSLLDESRCEALEESGHDNPFETAQLVLCDLSLALDNPNRLTQMIEARWDILVVDEAHHLGWSEGTVSPEYTAVEALSCSTAGLLLLTATPEQLGAEGHFARLRLLDPDRYHDLAGFVAEASAYQPLNALIEKLLADDRREKLAADPSLVPTLHKYVNEDRVQSLLAQPDEPGVVDDIVGDLLDRHGTGRVLFRNTRDAVGGFAGRVLIEHHLPPVRGVETDGYGVDDLLCPESGLGITWVREDPRVEWLVGWLKDHRGEKALVICARATTAQALEAYLRVRSGVRSSVFHEDMTLLARDRAAAYFSDDEEGAQVLVCSEIGSEGRNFQFVRHLIMFDLPLNPDLLEQRIGRLDRIGQKRVVQIHVPVHQSGPSAVLLRWYHDGLNAIERILPTSEKVLEKFRPVLLDCLSHPHDGEQLDQLIGETRTYTEQLLASLEQGRDRLLERSSFDKNKAAEIVAAIGNATYGLELADYMEALFDEFGVEQQPQSSHALSLFPSEHMICEQFPSLPEDGTTATYQRFYALAREDVQFLTWEHPMITGAMDMLLAGEYGNTAFCTLKLPSTEPGTLLLEAIFSIRCPAPRGLQLGRFLPHSMLRVVTDGKHLLSETLGEERLARASQRVPLRTAQELVRHARPRIAKLIQRSRRAAESQLAPIIETASQNVTNLEGRELERLEALARVNPNIRVAEIEQAAEAVQTLHRSLQGANLKLDAIRVMVTI